LGALLLKREEEELEQIAAYAEDLVKREAR
jgi:hypothetical protein